MRRWVRRILPAIIGVAILVGVVSAFLPKPVPVDVATAARGALQVTIDEDGKTRIKEPYTVSAPLAGRLLRIELEAGDPVNADRTVLAAIEPTSPELLNERELAQAKARVNAAEATVRRTEATLEAAKAALQVAESDYGRAKRLFDQGASTPEQFEAFELRFKTRTEEYRAARFNTEIAEFELEQARAALKQSQPRSEGENETEGNFVIRSPITGKVLRVFQESMTVVNPGTPLLEVGDPRDLELVIDVLSTDGVKINPGDKVIVEHWGGDRPLEARVKLVEPSAFTKISALGVEEQRVNVIANLVTPPDERPTLGDAFRIEAGIVVWEEPDVLQVPTGALFRHGDQWAVFVINEGHARLRTIQLGRRSELAAQVLEGIQAGEDVILYPSDRVRDGVAVERRADGEP